MIQRYRQEDIAQVWALENKYRLFLKIETKIAKELESQNIIPAGLRENLSRCIVDTTRIHELDLELKHDVLAFTTSIEEQLLPEHQSSFHYGVTSSDIIDTALMIQIKNSFEILRTELLKLLESIRVQVDKTSQTLCIGRTHGINAEPMVFAHKWLSFQMELERRILEIDQLTYTGMISGAVGTYTFISPNSEYRILEELSLSQEKVSTQVIPRDKILTYIHTLVSLSAFTQRLCIELRHLQHSDIAEVFESFSDKQKGSSIMPHKKNPISCENLTGITRLIQGYQSVAYSNCSLWHERDLTHSSAERIMLPDIFELSVYSIRRLTKVISNLHYDMDHIEKKVWCSPKIFSSRLLHIALNKTAKPRRETYKVIQQAFCHFEDLKDITKEIENELAIKIEFEPSKIKDLIISNFQKKLTNINNDPKIKGERS